MKKKEKKISYDAQKGCKKLTDYNKEDDDNDRETHKTNT